MGLFTKQNSGLTGLVLDNQQARFACIARDASGKPAVQVLQHAQLNATHNKPSDDASRALRRAAEGSGLDKARYATLLGHNDYQLLLVEAPDVRPEELRAAVRWRIKDLINFHIDDAVIDVFDIPGQANRAAGRMMYAVAARAGVIRARADLFEAAGLNLDIIDIPEMALRNVAALLPDDAHGIALLHLEPDHGFITLTRQGTLYLTRRLEIGYEALRRDLGQADVLDNIVLEIQRSLDYYESHYDTPPINNLIVTPLPDDLADTVAHLNSNLNVQVAQLDINTVLDDQSGTQSISADALTAVGCALRREEVAL
ncbi:MAG TPA: pilus assembly protein PilM [Gammaproteobacteria bacterium]|nr:pilus assembly protein PilM [Gammaproteobacteria bacterium]